MAGDSRPRYVLWMGRLGRSPFSKITLVQWKVSALSSCTTRRPKVGNSAFSDSHRIPLTNVERPL